MSAKVAVVTGGTSGIGKAAAQALKAQGCVVYELSRREAGGSDIPHISADVTDETSVESAFRQVMEKEGRVDIVINCAGFGISGAVEFTKTADAKRLFDVNFFGMVSVNRAALPIMRAQGSGRIVNTSSVAAPVSIPFQTYYSATKAAVNDYTCATANEVRPFGVSVCAVMPGDIHTGFTAAREKSCDGDEIYGGRISRSVQRMEHDELNGMSPEAAGAYIAKIALKKRVKPLYAIGISYKAACFLTKILPCGILNRMIYGLYAK